LVEAHEKRNGTYIRIRNKGIEIHLKKRGVRVHALDVRFPKQEGKNAYAEKYNYYLKEDR
jgi:hypothetical protein